MRAWRPGRYSVYSVCSVCSARQTVWRETPKVLATADWDCPLRRSSRMAAVWSGVKARGRPGNLPSSAARLTPAAMRRLIDSSSACAAQAITRSTISPIIRSTSVGWAPRGWSQDSAGAREAMPTPRRCRDSTMATSSTRLRLIRSRAATVRVSPRSRRASRPVHPGRSPSRNGAGDSHVGDDVDRLHAGVGQGLDLGFRGAFRPCRRRRPGRCGYSRKSWVLPLPRNARVLIQRETLPQTPGLGHCSKNRCFCYKRNPVRRGCSMDERTSSGASMPRAKQQRRTIPIFSPNAAPGSLDPISNFQLII